MAERKYNAYATNAPGPFYVECDMCITCRAPESVAPDLIGFWEDPSGSTIRSHCYFKKQPQTRQELEQAVKAVSACCVGSYRYAGSDPEVKKILRQAHCETAIDNDD